MSIRISRKSMPSVVCLIMVSARVRSSNRSEYSTSSPTLTSQQLAEVESTRSYPGSARCCVICVVFPHPVSPTDGNQVLILAHGLQKSVPEPVDLQDPSLLMDRKLGVLMKMPKPWYLPYASSFPANMSSKPCAIDTPSINDPRSSWANVFPRLRHGRFRTFGMESRSRRRVDP